MSHIPDMEEVGARTMAVGWLHPGHPFPRGAVGAGFLERVTEFSRRWVASVETLGWPVAMGFHRCEFCNEATGAGTFGVPTGDRIFLVPEMVTHYVERHGYAPPAEFVSAVMACPLPGTPEYAAAVAPFITPLR